MSEDLALHKRSQEWQPIQTAPKDGACVLLYDNTCEEPVVGFWHASGWLVAWDHSRYDTNFPGCDPTHWMPLPEPPKE
jgi:hypothetical protein